MPRPLPQWLIPIAGCSPVAITIDDRFANPMVQIVDVPPGPMTSLECCQLGMALTEAIKYCGELRAKRKR